jgi:hypothetical protein
MESVNLLAAFASALVGAVVGSWTSVWLGAKRNRREASDQALFGIYLQLLELNGFYFWISTADLHREERKADIIKRVESIARSIADDLRKVRDAAAVREVFDVIASSDPVEYPDSATRLSRLNQLLQELGHRFNPEYMEAAGRVGTSRMKSLAEGITGTGKRLTRENAPLFLN